MRPHIVHTSRIITAYRRYLASADSLRYSQQVNEFYSISTLVKLLRFGVPETRRAASLALGMAGDQAAIEPLGRALSDTDRGVRLAADDGFRATLIRNAAPVHHQQLLRIMHLNDGGEFAAALPPALILTEHASNYAEAHNQLAICWQGLKKFEVATIAYQKCLWLCRFHYPAWIGLAQCKIHTQNLQGAIQAYERSVQICPDLEHSRIQAKTLRKQIGLSES